MRTSKQDKGFERHPELLTAALLGDWEQLERLLTKGEGEAPQFVIPMEDDDIMSSAAATTSADGGAEALITTTSGDSLLHVVAYTGDGDRFLKTATVIYRKASHLLDAPNNKGDTPLHCAVRAGWVAMVSLLVHLAKSENADNDYKVKAMLRTLNMRGETVLSVAVRLGRRHIINGLIAEDPQLARFPQAGGTSPLYLAVELGHEDIARQLHENDQELSYTGPDGRNALHAAVVKGQDATKMLLEWNKDLIKEAERSTGSTPLHLAASWGRHEAMCLLLATDPSTACQPDKKGSFPIHVAAFAEEMNAVSVLLDRCPNCAKLRDAEGMTFLHVAVKEKRQSVVEYACKWQSQEFQSSVMNMQDDDGNTALHLAAKIGKLGIFNPLMKNRLVKLNITNNSGKTPLDLAWIDMGKKVHDELVNFFPYILQHPRTRIFRLLQYAGAQTGTYRRNLSYGHISDPELQEKLDHELDQKVTSSTQIVGFGSVLIGTVAFAAAFTLPGGYRADEKKYGGTPMLAGHSAFHVFIIANTLAFILSSLSIALLTYAGISEGGIDSGINTRMTFVIIATALMTSSARSLSIAFVFGLYVVLDPVAHTTAMASSAITALVLADVVWFLWKALTSELVLMKRLGARACWRLALAILMILLGQLWPYIVIAGVVKCIKIKGVSST